MSTTTNPNTTTTAAAPTGDPRHPQPPTRALGWLIVSLLAVTVVSLVGRAWTDTAPESWYGQLDKPAWTPPGAVFGIVWTILYLAMAVAAWLVARHGLHRGDVRRALLLYGLQLVLNLGWTATFFAAERPGWAVVEIALLFVALIATMAYFGPISNGAFWLLVPYACWVAYAASLTIGIAALNT